MRKFFFSKFRDCKVLASFLSSKLFVMIVLKISLREMESLTGSAETISFIKLIKMIV